MSEKTISKSIILYLIEEGFSASDILLLDNCDVNIEEINKIIEEDREEKAKWLRLEEQWQKEKELKIKKEKQLEKAVALITQSLKNDYWGTFDYVKDLIDLEKTIRKEKDQELFEKFISDQLAYVSSCEKPLEEHTPTINSERRFFGYHIKNDIKKYEELANSGILF